MVNLGHRVTRMHFLQGGECVGVREIDMGLADLDRIIADKLDVEIHVAHGISRAISTVYWKRSIPRNFTAVWRWRS